MAKWLKLTGGDGGLAAILSNTGYATGTSTITVGGTYTLISKTGVSAQNPWDCPSILWAWDDVTSGDGYRVQLMHYGFTIVAPSEVEIGAWWGTFDTNEFGPWNTHTAVVTHDRSTGEITVTIDGVQYVGPSSAAQNGGSAYRVYDTSRLAGKVGFGDLACNVNWDNLTGFAAQDFEALTAATYTGGASIGNYYVYNLGGTGAVAQVVSSGVSAALAATPSAVASATAGFDTYTRLSGAAFGFASTYAPLITSNRFGASVYAVASVYADMRAGAQFSASGASSMVPKTYTVDSSTPLDNPERGFIKVIEEDSGMAFSAWTVSDFNTARTNDQCTFYALLLYLNGFISTPTTAISTAFLNRLTTQLTNMRSAGVKCYIRASYNQDGGTTDAPVSQVLAHIDQLAAVWSNFTDVIVMVQAGFVGPWGEWWQSANFGTINLSAGAKLGLSDQNWADRKAVVDKLLAVLPSSTTVALRIPSYKKWMYGNTSLADNEAFTGTSRARIGHHNDAFLSSATDMGTYLDAAQSEYPYLDQETKYLPMGGESAAYNPPRSDGTTAQLELTRFHYTYLNDAFETNTLNAWKTQGVYNTIKNKLGYRLELVSANLPDRIAAGTNVSFTLTLRNTGYAAPLVKRDLFLILRNTSSGAVTSIALNYDCRLWLPGSNITLSPTVAVPSGLADGSYAVAFHMRDPNASLASNPKYAVRFANTSTWESSTGYNLLNHTLVVGAATPSAVASVSGALTTSIRLAAPVSAVQSVSGDLRAAPKFAASVAGQASVSALLGMKAFFASTPKGTSTAQAVLTTRSFMEAYPWNYANLTGTLTSPSYTSIASSAAATTQVSGALLTFKRLAGAPAVTATATADLRISVRMVGTVSASPVATGDLDSKRHFFANVYAIADATGSLNTNTALSGAASAFASGTVDMAASVSVAALISATSVATATLGVAVRLVASVAAQAYVTCHFAIPDAPLTNVAVIPAGVRCVLLEIGVKSAGVETTRYLSSRPYVTMPTDTPANTIYLPIIVGGVKFTESVSVDSDSFSLSYGDIEIDNTDGSRDSWLTDIWTNRTVKVYIGDASRTRDTFTKIFDGVVAGIDSKRFDRLNLSLSDKMQRLNAPMTEAKLGGDSQNKDRLLPLCFGEVHNVEPLLTSAALNEYQVHDGQIERIIEVRDNGVPVSFTPYLTTGKFRLNQAPVGTITCSVQGDKTPTYSNNAAVLIQRIVTRYGNATRRFTGADLNLTNFNSFAAVNTMPVGIYLSDKTNVLDVINKLATSVGGRCVMSRDGLLGFLRVGAIDNSAVTVTNATTTYAESTARLNNPARGWTYAVETLTNNAAFYTTERNDSAGNFTLFRFVVDLSAFTTTSLSGTFLTNLNTALSNMRSGGAKCLIRFRYTTNIPSPTATTQSPGDATKAQMLAHITQLTSVLQANADIIVAIEAGFIGAYGEWWYSDTFGSLHGAPNVGATDYGFTPQQWADRKAIADALIAVVKGMPYHRCVLFRTPTFVYNMYGSTPVGEANKFGSSDIAHIGMFNDAFVSTSTDENTYRDTTFDYDWLKKQSLYSPMGGESEYAGDPARGSCPTATQEMAWFHWSYCNPSWNPDTVKLWKDQGCFAGEMDLKLGYRFVIMSSTMPTNLVSGSAATISISMANRGYAATMNRYVVKLVLRSVKYGHEHAITLAADTRNWLPGTFVVNESVSVPALNTISTTIQQRVALVGDSTMGGYIGGTSTKATNNPAATFRANVPTNWAIQDEGVNGASIKELLNGTDGVHPVWATWLSSYTGKYIFINHAINDSSEAGTTPDTYEANLRTVVQQAQSAGKVVILQTSNPCTFQTNLLLYLARMRTVATDLNCPLVDVWQYLTDYMAANGLTTANITNDGVHPIDSVYKMVGEYQVLRFKEVLAEATSWEYCLHICDEATTLQSNPLYSIQTANVGLWESTTGYNKLGLTATATTTAPTTTVVSTLVTPADMVDRSISVSDMLPVKAAVKVGFCKNYTVQEALQTGLPTDHIDLYAQEWLTVTRRDSTTAFDYSLHTEPDIEETQLLREVDANAEADRRLNLYRVQRKVIKYTGFANLMTQKLGDAQTLQHWRFGLSSGVSGQIVSLSTDWLAAKVEVGVLI